MGEEALVGGQCPVCPVQVYLALREQPLHPLEVVLHPQGCPLFQADVVRVNAVLAEVNAVVDGLDEALLGIQFQLQTFRHELLNPPAPLPELIDIVREHYDVVHVADVVVNAELTLGKLVHLVLVDIGQHLIEQTADCQPLVGHHLIRRDVLQALARWVAEFLPRRIHKQVQHEPRVVVALAAHEVKRYLMVDAVEEFTGVQLLNVEAAAGPAFGIHARLLLESASLLHEVMQPLGGGVRAPALDAGVGILNVALHEGRIDNLIDRPLYHAMGKRLPHDEPVHGIMYDALAVRPRPVGLVPQCLLEVVEVVLQIRAEPEDFIPVAFAFPGVEVSGVQILIVRNPLFDMLDSFQ